MNKRSNLALFSGIYAIFYAFCLYKNLGGATFPFFVIGTLFYIWLCTREFGLTWKKDSLVEVVAVIAVGISHPLTSNFTIHFLNILVTIALIFHIVLHQFAEDREWTFFQNVVNLIVTLGGGLSHFFAPVWDYLTYKRRKEEEGNNEKKPSFPIYVVVLTVIVCIPVLAIVMLLLGSADAVFRDMIKGLFKMPNLDSFGVIILIAFVFFFSYGAISKMLSKPFKSEEASIKKGNTLVVVTAGIMFDLVYLLFSFIQIFYLFIGKFTLPEGYTYAEYAREGYFELLFVCVLNLGMVLIGIFFFKENKLVKIILSVLCGCTYVMTASSAFRMILYIRYYYFSFLRIFVLWSLLVIFLLLTGLMMQIWKKDFRLFKYSIMVCSLCYVFLAFATPDYFIAKWNLANSDGNRSAFFLSESSYRDYNYLVYELSEDAAPVLMNNENTKDGYISWWLEIDEERKFTFRNFNLAKYRSHRLLSEFEE